MVIAINFRWPLVFRLDEGFIPEITVKELLARDLDDLVIERPCSVSLERIIETKITHTERPLKNNPTLSFPRRRELGDRFQICPRKRTGFPRLSRTLIRDSQE